MQLVPLLLIPAMVVVLGVALLRQERPPQGTWDYRHQGGLLAVLAGAGWLLIGIVRVLSGT
jgi:hypothetical protein